MPPAVAVMSWGQDIVKRITCDNLEGANKLKISWLKEKRNRNFRILDETIASQ